MRLDGSVLRVVQDTDITFDHLHAHGLTDCRLEYGLWPTDIMVAGLDA
jgi:hypothetical protein